MYEKYEAPDNDNDPNNDSVTIHHVESECGGYGIGDEGGGETGGGRGDEGGGETGR